MTDDAQYESLTAEDLGLAPGARMPLRFSPGRSWTPLVISFPHVGLAWPHDLRPKPQVDFARNADLEVQTLYADANAMGAATVEAVYSRLVVDLNRAPDDVSSVVVPDHPAPRPRRSPGVPSAEHGPHDHGHRLDRPGRGVVWASAVGNVRILDGPLSFQEFEHRIDRYHRPYYRALEVLLERRRQRFGYAILLDAHSMPSSVGVDLVVGTLGASSCGAALERSALYALRRDADPFSVQLNEPYRGGEVIRRFGRPSEGLHALQLEVSRRLYMDEATTTLWDHPVPPDVLEPPDGLRRDGELAESPGFSPSSRQSGTSPGSVRETERRRAFRRSGREVANGPRRPAGPIPLSTPLQDPLNAPHRAPGTLRSPTTLSTAIGRVARPPSRQARDLADLLARVRCLIRRLALETSPLGLDRPSGSTAEGPSRPPS